MTFGLGIKGVRLSGSLMGRQKEIGSGEGYFWKMVPRTKAREVVPWSGNREQVYGLGRKVNVCLGEGKAGREVRERT